MHWVHINLRNPRWLELVQSPPYGIPHYRIGVLPQKNNLKFFLYCFQCCWFEGHDCQRKDHLPILALYWIIVSSSHLLKLFPCLSHFIPSQRKPAGKLVVVWCTFSGMHFEYVNGSLLISSKREIITVLCQYFPLGLKLVGITKNLKGS